MRQTAHYTGYDVCLTFSEHPWFEVFVKLLNVLAENISQCSESNSAISLLEHLLELDVSKRGTEIAVSYAVDKVVYCVSSAVSLISLMNRITCASQIT